MTMNFSKIYEPGPPAKKSCGTKKNLAGENQTSSASRGGKKTTTPVKRINAKRRQNALVVRKEKGVSQDQYRQ